MISINVQNLGYWYYCWLSNYHNKMLLQISLEGSATSGAHRGNNITHIPKLQDTLRFFR